MSLRNMSLCSINCVISEQNLYIVIIMQKKYDYAIVGAGLFGATFAERVKHFNPSARILVIDKRDHIAGNCYTRREDNYDVHVYGPHIFHTSSERIWNYVNKFSKFNNFTLRTKAMYKNRIYSLPVNLMTFHQVFGVTTPSEAKKRVEYEIRAAASKGYDTTTFEGWARTQVGDTLYEMFYDGYTRKQWGRHPNELPASIAKRLPIRFMYDDNYFNDTYQGIPVDGYTAIVDKMLRDTDVQLNTDFFTERTLIETLANKIVYTGPIDALLNYKHGKLEYRSLKFEHSTFKGDYQGNAIINYTDVAQKWTRIVEHKHFVGSTSENSIFTKEFPASYESTNEPYYPVNDTKNNDIASLYAEDAKKLSNYIVGGRLGSYRYYDMHQVIAEALTAAQKEGYYEK